MKKKWHYVLIVALFGALFTGPAQALTATEVEKLLASDGAQNDWFGFTVSVDGNTALIGAGLDDDNGDSSGSAYVFTRDGNGVWSQQAKLLASDGAQDDFFGGSVSIDGDTALIAARGDDDVGSAYVFTRDGNGVWSQQAKLLANDGTAIDLFGVSVSIDGGTALIGASRDDDHGRSSGSAYVFVRDGNGDWVQQAKLLASDGAQDDEFGKSVSVDGDTALIGAERNNDNAIPSGSAYVFTRDTDGNWSQQAKLLSDDRRAGDFFGTSVAVDGDTALIGADRDDNENGTNAGSTYVFTRDGLGAWAQQAKLLAGDGEEFEAFGNSVSVDGDTVLIGDRGNDNENGSSAGAAYVFTRDGSGAWTQQAKLLASDGAENDDFGFFVSIDGNTGLIGAPRDDNDNGLGAGSAYVFQLGEESTNEPPEVDAGPDAPIRAGSIVQLEATVSDDNTPEAELSVQWQVIAQPQGSQVEFFTPNALATEVRVDTDGTYEVGLTVTDSENASTTDSLTLSDTNLAPIADAGEDQLVYAGATVTLDASGGHDPEGDPIVDYEWVLALKPEGSTAALSETDVVSPQFVADLPGSYRIDNLIADFLGFGEPDSVEVTALSPEDFAQVQVLEASETVAQLDETQVTNSGNQQSMGEFFKQAVRLIQNEKPEQAVKKLNDARNRTDGCLDGGGQPDERGPGRDWVTDCDAQTATVLSIDQAINALSP